VWDKLTEICAEYLRNESHAYSEDSLQARSYEDNDGATKYATEIRVREMPMLGGGEERQAPQRRARQQPARQPEPVEAFEPDSDLPF
jgi:single-strand DNA-binding protein